MYGSYQRSYEDYCYGEGFQNPYPATPKNLVEWVALNARRAPSSRVNPGSTRNQFYRASRQSEQFMSRGSFPLLHSTIPRSSSLLQEHADYKARERRQNIKAEPLSIRQLEEITSPAPESLRPTVTMIRRSTLMNLRLATSQTQRSTISILMQRSNY